MSGKVLYFLRESLQGFRSNWIMSIASITTVMVLLSVLGFFIILATNLSFLIKQVESKVQIDVFLKDSVTAQQVTALQQKILAWPEVKSAEYVSKDKALERLREDFRKNPEVLAVIEGNPLPASIEIVPRDPKNVFEIASKLKDPRVIDDVRYRRDIVQRLFQITNIVRWIGGLFTTVLSLASLVVIINTIRLTIYARRREIAIMKLVGASNWFVRWPFVMEGVLQGAIGAVLAVSLLSFLNATVFERVLAELKWLEFRAGLMNTASMAGTLSLVGITIGTLGSVMALRRFLKV